MIKGKHGTKLTCRISFYIQKMSAPKLIFSFAAGMDFAVKKDELPDGAVMKFGQGFDNAEVKFGSVSVAVLKPEANRSAEPVVEFNLRSAEEFPPLKRVLVEKNSVVAVKSAVRTVGTVPRAVTVTPIGLTVSAPAAAPAAVKGKSVQVADEPVAKEGLTFAPISSVFEIGSSSRSAPLTRTQRRNKNRKVAKVKRVKIDELAVPADTPVTEEEAGLPLEVQLPSLRVAVANKMTTEENAKLQLEELENLEGKRLLAQQNLELYQAKMIQAHDKLVRPRTFQVGDLVLVLKRPILAHRKIGGKFEPTWEGPFVVEKVSSGGAYQLIDCQGERPMLPINGRYLKKDYAS